LRRETSYTTSIAVLDGADVLYVERVRGFRREQSKIDLDLGPGSRLPAYCTALGKVLLAYLPDHELRNQLADMTLSRRAVNTIKSKKVLREELANVSKAGFAVCDEELAAGLRSIAVPVRSQSGEVVAAINMASHSSMISRADFVTGLLPHLIVAADRLSGRLGYRREDQGDE
jgi:IclR family transcriptional regulator, pca regulon regulatory protein